MHSSNQWQTLQDTTEPKGNASTNAPSVGDDVLAHPVRVDVGQQREKQRSREEEEKEKEEEEERMEGRKEGWMDGEMEEEEEERKEGRGDVIHLMSKFAAARCLSKSLARNSPTGKHRRAVVKTLMKLGVWWREHSVCM